MQLNRFEYYRILWNIEEYSLKRYFLNLKFNFPIFIVLHYSGHCQNKYRTHEKLLAISQRKPEKTCSLIMIF